MDYSQLTRDASTEGVTLRMVFECFAPFAHRKIPALNGLLDASVFPPAPLSESVADPVVEVKHPKIDCLPVYHMAGFASALPTIMLRESIIEMLGRVADGLPENFGLTVFDGWRPLALQQEIFDLSGGDTQYVSVPSSDPSLAPPHGTGGTVDLTLSYRHRPLAIGTHFDDFSPLAHTDSLEREDHVDKFLRRVLFWYMYSEGFVNYPTEWWHYEFGTRRWAHANQCDAIFARVDNP